MLGKPCGGITYRTHYLALRNSFANQFESHIGFGCQPTHAANKHNSRIIFRQRFKSIVGKRPKSTNGTYRTHTFCNYLVDILGIVNQSSLVGVDCLRKECSFMVCILVCQNV